MSKVKNIIFDLGGVLIDWNPEYLYLEVFKGDRKKMQWFFDEICTMDWNENQDAGYPLHQATEDRIKMFPQYEEWIRMYYGSWEEMLGDSIDETVEILNKLLKKTDYRVVALTNWSAETFPVALDRFKFLQRFEGIVVSGAENTRKPFADIYQLTLNRFNFKAEESLFIDDNLKNVEAASNMGIHTIHFKNPKDLQLNLEAKAILL
jgi:2-haloacid dehalogenase